LLSDLSLQKLNNEFNNMEKVTDVLEKRIKNTKSKLDILKSKLDNSFNANEQEKYLLHLEYQNCEDLYTKYTREFDILIRKMKRRIERKNKRGRHFICDPHHIFQSTCEGIYSILAQQTSGVVHVD